VRRGALAAALGLVAVGLGLSIELTRIHHRVHTDPEFASICNISDAINCENVARSPYSVVLGLPVSAWGILAYLTIGGLVLSGLARRRIHDTWPCGILFWLFTGAVAASIALGIISATRIDSLCIYCVGLYAVSLALFADGFALLRNAGVGPVAALVADLRALLAKPAAGLAVALLAAALVAGPMLAMPVYWESPGWSELPRLPSGVDDDGHHWIGAETPILSVVEFSDYECPYCRTAHRAARALAAEYPDEVRLIHRHLPLDQACNPIIRRPFHRRACEFARAAECAGDQAMFWQMNDALFAAQDTAAAADVDVGNLAVRVGLDRSAFNDCMVGGRVPASIRADLEAALEKRVEGTPTFFIGTTIFTGNLPPDALRSGVTRARRAPGP
jgi:protein-disulfide isomerase/uncharacterized membrane protein